MKQPKKRVKYCRVEDLTAHPQQPDLFPDLPNVELQSLADDIKKNGLIHPVEILPGGTIIAGHQRVRAAKLLGWTEIRCWIRDDLADAGEAAVEHRLIEDNFNRRQLTMLDRARCFRRLRELYHGKRGLNGKVKGDLRDYLAAQFGVSGRTLDRWDRVLDTPLAIQQAVSSNKLTLDLGGKVADLSKEAQLEIAEKIRNGEDAKEVVVEYIKQEGKVEKSFQTSWHQFLRGLKQATEEISPRVGEVRLGGYQSRIPMLQKAQKLIAMLITKIEEDVAKEEEKQ